MKILFNNVSKTLVTLLLIIVGFAALNGCQSTVSEVTYYTVSFETNGGNTINPVLVENGRKLASDTIIPVKEDGSVFIGWFKDNVTFSVPWDFNQDIVTGDVTLYAKWILAQPFPTEVSMSPEAFSSSISWIQTGVDDGSSKTLTFFLGVLSTRTETQLDEDGAEITVTIEYYQYSETGIEIVGTTELVNNTNVLWTPNDDVQGGVYKVDIPTEGEDTASIEDLYFKGVGTEENPYLLFDSTDMLSISTTDNIGEGKFYQVVKSFSHEVAYDEIVNNTFLGDLNGNGFTITVLGNAGMFYELGDTGVVHDLTVSGVITTASIPLLGGVSIRNNGLIENVTSRVALTSSAGVVGDPSSKEDGGAGGLVGINLEDGIIRSSSFVGTSSSDGVVKAYIGGGGIASINYGLISDCENRGTLGAYNSVESGKSMSNYSYMGGIAGFNYGLITRSSTTSTGKLLGQRYYNNGEPTDTANNRVIGGIVGYNAAEGEVTESFFNGIRVHGDQYVGGIAGINAGLIDSSYTGGRYYTSTTARSYIAGRLNVGGIAGAQETGGVITNCYNAANVYSYEDIAYAIAEYATNSVYLYVNHDLRATGDQVYGNASSDNPTAPIGAGNVMVSNTSLVSGDAVYYTLPGSYAGLLGNLFVDSNNETLLAWQVQP